tara:strand:+ start:6454 stop:7464 length:1011 start_codon:yes stop_codon:yes gene_type:complete
MTDQLLERAANLLRAVPGWPETHVTFYDLNPVLHDPEVVEHLARLIADEWRDRGVTFIAMLDARGFIIGARVAQLLGLPMTMIRKKGKLPPPTLSFTYKLEYGTATMEIADDGSIKGQHVLILDDLLATGGTSEAAVELVYKAGGKVAGFACITELPALGGRGKLLSVPVQSLITIVDGVKMIDAIYCVDILTLDTNTDPEQLLLVDRQGDVPGISMPGGKIDPGESITVASIRELWEEVHCNAKQVFYLGTLCGVGRDPRGNYVSIVVAARVDGKDAIGEVIDGKSKTEVRRVIRPDLLESIGTYAFPDHLDFLRVAWPEILTAQAEREKPALVS